MPTRIESAGSVVNGIDLDPDERRTCGTCGGVDVRQFPTSPQLSAWPIRSKVRIKCGLGWLVAVPNPRPSKRSRTEPHHKGDQAPDGPLTASYSPTALACDRSVHRAPSFYPVTRFVRKVPEFRETQAKRRQKFRLGRFCVSISTPADRSVMSVVAIDIAISELRRPPCAHTAPAFATRLFSCIGRTRPCIEYRGRPG
jgi:hypothetical protein